MGGRELLGSEFPRLEFPRLPLLPLSGVDLPGVELRVDPDESATAAGAPNNITTALAPNTNAEAARPNLRLTMGPPAPGKTPSSPWGRAFHSERVYDYS